jgi:hypothetical protein
MEPALAERQKWDKRIEPFGDEQELEFFRKTLVKVVTVLAQCGVGSPDDSLKSMDLFDMILCVNRAIGHAEVIYEETYSLAELRKGGEGHPKENGDPTSPLVV